MSRARRAAGPDRRPQNPQLRAGRFPDLKARFEREARLISQRRHPKICLLHDAGSEGGTDFLVMEFLEGATGPTPWRRVGDRQSFLEMHLKKGTHSRDIGSAPVEQGSSPEHQVLIRNRFHNTGISAESRGAELFYEWNLGQFRPLLRMYSGSSLTFSE
ncbi:MAG TPA: hypothetical protein VME18_02910 [Acidobacteriaceae bacterium]|nr:hypothetical protein [Acidobacteriaceae bacterium]